MKSLFALVICAAFVAGCQKSAKDELMPVPGTAQTSAKDELMTVPGTAQTNKSLTPVKIVPAKN